MVRKRLHIAKLMAVRLLGTIGNQQRQELEHWKAENQTHLEEYEEIKKEFNSGRWKENLQHIDVGLEWKVFNKKKLKAFGGSTSIVRKICRQAIPLPYAAAVAALIVFAWLFFYPDHLFRTDDQFTTIEAPMGSKTRVVLPDGSHVWLNAGSTITYHNDYNLHSRTVQLCGEAFFDVEQRNLPFVVRTPELNILALGTSFNVKAYADDPFIETTLVSGRLLIEKSTLKGSRLEDIQLKPNQKAIFYRELGTLSLRHTDSMPEEVEEVDLVKTAKEITRVKIQQKVDVTPEVGWKDGILLIDSEPLIALARILERRYNVSIVFKDEGLQDYVYSGRLKEPTLEQVMRAMQLTSPITFSIEDKMVYLSVDPETEYKYHELIH